MNDNIKHIFIHHTKVSYDLNPDQFDQTNQYHKEKWNTISSLGFYGGYNFEISKNGTARQFRKIGEMTIAAIDYNYNSIHIALDGDFDVELPTIEQKNALRTLLEGLIRDYNLSPYDVRPHRSVCGNPPYKSCYGWALSDTWASDLVNNDPVLIRALWIQVLELTKILEKLLAKKKSIGFVGNDLECHAE